jgi:phosphatidylinositol alpha 1,6-mannosyltransferase
VTRVEGRWTAGRELAAALAAWSPDVVLVLSPGALGRAALVQARRRGTRTVVVEQSPLLDVTAGYWRSTVAGRADELLVTSGWMVDRVAELGAHAGLWRPGVDTAAYTPARRDPWLLDRWAARQAPGGPASRSRTGVPAVVGHVGPLRRRQGVRRLAALAARPDVALVVVGDGPERGWLEHHLPHARFTGPLSSGELASVLPSLDVLVATDRHGTCCHALRAAAAAGVPSVAPRSGGATEVVRHGVTGLLHDPADDAAFVAAVAALGADPQRGEMGRRARELSTRTWSEAIDELLARHLPAAAPAPRVA